MSAAQACLVEPEQERSLSIDVRRDGVAVLTLGVMEPQNTLAAGFTARLLATIARIEDDASIAAAVLVCGRGDFAGAGAPAGPLRSVKLAKDAERLASALGQALCKLAGLRKPVVAAVGGNVLGGAFEIALACHAIVASDDARTALGLPGVRLGLIPAANGLLRIASRAGLRAAIDLGLSGDLLRPGEALALGLVDEVCPESIRLDVSARIAKALVGRVPRSREPRMGSVGLLLEKSAVARTLLFKRARSDARARGGTHGVDGAAGAILEVLECFATRGFDAAAELEARAFGECVVSETAHRLGELSSALAAIDRDPGVSERAEARPVRHLAVHGGGPQASGIAYVTLTAGVRVRLHEADDEAVGAALREVKALFDARVAKRELTALESEQLFAEFSITTDLSGLRNADVVIEAAPEDLALKRAIVAGVEALVGPSCTIGSTTSFLPISKIALGAAHPERVVGMHYFSPVPGVPLLEVVRAEKTAPWAVATAVSLGKRQGKTAIVVKDGPGFYAARVMVPWFNEALHLLSEGVTVDAIDDSMVDWGFPVGPIRRMGELGIDAHSQAALGLHAAFGARMAPPGILAKLIADGRKGRPNGRGFYRTTRVRKGQHVVDTSVYAALGVEPRTKLPPDEIQMRCALAMINEALRCLGDGVLRAPRDGDVGAVLGLGFPRLRGGPFRYVDAIGAADVLRRIQSYAERFGERWRPAPLLVQLAKKGERLLG